MASSGEAGGNSRGILESWPFRLLTVNRSPNLLICNNKISIAVLQSDWHIIFVFSKFLLKIFMLFWKVTFHLQLLQNRFFLKKCLFIYLAVLGRRCGRWDLLPWHEGFSLVVAHELSCPKAWGIWGPQPEIEPVSPTSAGRFFNTGPPGKLHKIDSW